MKNTKQRRDVRIYCTNVQYFIMASMQVRIVKMRNHGVEIDRRLLRDAAGARGLLIIADVTDQGLHRPCKTARLLQGEMIRAELKDVSLVWANDGRMTLAGYERVVSEAGQVVDYRQSWLVFIDNEAGTAELPKRRITPTR
ncbi:hypothetical protein [Massilia sp. LjRoot122]|uniref:hypothetical protein n=1 Tax=Massilia sp. LjRoot122 TaxID=3342257 RepID=UPI003ECE3508